MKMKYTLEYVDMGDEIVAVPVGKNAQEMKGVLKLNSWGREICDLLGEDTTEEAIVDRLCDKYENSREAIRSFVSSFLPRLREAGLLEE